ncbi:hypothetical protein [Streptomyces paradoxus]|uniref:hypothetical protein n=1 Tax=Streptomyces paradoxus TaxID=66375 RepID=UPI0037F7AC2E
MTAEPADAGILRRHFVAIATSRYDDYPPLPRVVDEVEAMKAWLCSAALGRRAFTHVHPDLSDDPSDAAIREALQDPPEERAWRDSHAAVVFITGHGETADQRHWTVVRSTRRGKLKSTALETALLLGWLMDSEVRHLFVVLDMCFAGKTAEEVIRFDAALPETWLVLPSVTKEQEAVPGALTGAVSAFLADLGSPIGARWRGAEVPFLDVQDFLSGVREKLGPGQQLIPLYGCRQTGPHPCLPNPHYRDEERTPVAVGRSDLALPQRDLEAHWEPRSRGVARQGESGWLFSGRTRLMGDLIAGASQAPGVWVVTGGAGSGKSAALARLVTFSDPGFRKRYAAQVQAVPEAVRPPEGAVDVAVLATGKNAHDIIVQISTAMEVPAPAEAHSLDAWVTAWQEWLSRRDRPLTVVVDALDEATDPLAVLASVLARLDPGQARLRLVVGIRSPGGDDADPATRTRGMPVADLAEQLLAATRIRVDQAPWWEPADLVHYAAFVLTTSPGTPYADLAVVRPVAAALARHAGTSFLVTRIAATSLSRRPAPVDATDAAWLSTVDDGVLGVFRADLRSLCPTAEQRLRAVHLLRAVAFARGRGLPWLGLWPALANVIADDPERTYGDSDIADLLASPLGGYLVTDTADGTTVYRLFHDALRGTLRESWRDLVS